MTADDLVISTEGLTKTYGDVLALKNLDLQVPQKSIFASWDPTGRARRPPSSSCWV